MSASAATELVEAYGALAHRDTIAFCDYYRPQILHPLHGYIPFVPHDYQRKLLSAMDDGGQHVILKARQTGISTTIMIQKLRRCLEGERTILCVSRKSETAMELIRIAYDAMTRCDPPFPLRLVTDNKHALVFENGARLVAETSSPDTGRTYAVSDVVIDEFAFLPWQEEMWQSLRPTVSRGARVVIPSTPDMEGDLFEQRWQDAQLAGSQWQAHRVHWRDCPEYDDEWFATNRPDYTAAEWGQEFECEFGSTKDAVFRSEFVKRAVELGETPWERTEASKFAVGGDLAGEGRDWSVLIAIDCSVSPAMVCEVRGWEVVPAPILQAEIEKAAADFETTPWIDRSGIGWGIAQNVSCPVVAVNFTGGSAVTGERNAPNIPRTLLVNNLVLGLEQGLLAIPRRWQELIMGLRSYSWDKRKGRFADFVDALALAWWSVSNRPSEFFVSW